MRGTSNQERTGLSNLTVRETAGGLRYIIYVIQKDKLKEELSRFLSCNRLKSVKIQGLNPFIGIEEGLQVIRVGGRLLNSDLAWETIHPTLIHW